MKGQLVLLEYHIVTISSPNFTLKEWICPIWKSLHREEANFQKKCLFIWLKYAEEHGKKFIATYRQTECWAPMTYLPYNLLNQKSVA